MGNEISQFNELGMLSGEDEFILIDNSTTSSDANISKIQLSLLSEKIITRTPQNGERGDVGDTGDAGLANQEKGNSGDKGIEGLRGIRGERGDDGDYGEVGNKGFKGQTGQNGSHGLKGDKGLIGDKGDTGPDGYKGSLSLKSRGIRGEEGDTGKKGDTGPVGEKGLPGDLGLVNYGLKGERGDVGESSFGPRGEKGTQGSKGIKGDFGDKGVPGNSYVYLNSPRRTMILPTGEFRHPRHLYESPKFERNRLSFEWDSEILKSSDGNIGDYIRRFLIFELDSTNFTDHAYSKYLVEVDFEPFIFGNTSPVINKVTLSSVKNNQTFGDVGLDWFKDDTGSFHIMFFSVAPFGSNEPLMIKKVYTHIGSTLVGSQNTENFRI